MRIIYHHRTRGDGAEGIHIQEMYHAFELLGHEMRMVCPAASRRELGIQLGMKGITSKEAKTKKGYLKIVLTHTLELAYNAISFFRLFWSILFSRPDFVYERYSCYHFGGGLACFLLNVPLVLEVNSTYAGRFARRQLAYPRLCNWIEKWMLQSSKMICVVSNSLKACVEDRDVDSVRILVTPNAINPAHQIHGDSIRKRVREDLGIAPNAIVVGFVGSLRRWHGVELLSEVIPRVIEQCPSCVFLIVGTGELETEIRESVQNRAIGQYVRFTGAVDYELVPQFIDSMDIGLMPDSNEWGSPMKILEYMLQGKVVVAPRLGPIEEIVQHGRTGILFDRLNLDGFESAIIKLLQSSKNRKLLGQNARDYVLSERTWIANAQKVLATVLNL